MGGRHDRPKVVCAPDRDLARLRGTVLRPPSAVPSLGGFRTPAAEYAAPSLKRPASETLHRSGHRQHGPVMSALCPTCRLMHCSKQCAGRNGYSITLSARATSVGGTSRPRALAALRLMTSSKIVGSWTGRSAGLAPLRTFPA